MGINLDWANAEKTILCHTYDGTWTVEDLYNAVDENCHLLAEKSYTIDLIIDMRTSGPPPSGVLSAYQYAERQKPANQGLVVMVEPGAVMRAFNRVISSVAPNISVNRTIVSSVEEARELIKQHYNGVGTT